MPFGLKKKDKQPASSSQNGSSSNPYAQAPSSQSNPYAQAPSNSNPYAGAASSNTPSYGSSRQQSTNPYAALDSVSNSNPYGGRGSDPYSTSRPSGGSPNPYGGNSSSNGNSYGGVPSQSTNTGYSAGKYGSKDGYGADRYGTKASSTPQASSTSAYASLDNHNPYSFSNQQEVDEFGTVIPQGGKAASFVSQAPTYATQDPNNQGLDFGFGGTDVVPQPIYDDRQLTAEEEEEQDVQATKQQIKNLKREDVASTRNALRLLDQAEMTGRDTLARLGVQGEMIHNTAKNLDLAHNQNRLAEDKARELKKLNKSMFAVHIGNPMTSKSRREARDQAIVDRHLEERDQRESTRREAYLTSQRMQSAFKDIDKEGRSTPSAADQKARNLADRSKYQFEADSDDENMENEIDDNLDLMASATSRLNVMARATGKEVAMQNDMLGKIAEKSDRVDLGLANNAARLNRIK